MVAFSSLFLNAQNTKQYYLEIKPGYELGSFQLSTNLDQTLVITMANQDFANVLNNNSVYTFEKMYPTAPTPRLKRVYFVEISENFVDETIISQRNEVERFFLIEDENLIDEGDHLLLPSTPPFVLPNDYDDPFTGERYTAYDLIKLPLAWTITTGDPSVLIGVDDVANPLEHPDLEGQIFDTIFISEYNGSLWDHGVAVSGKIVAKANNNQYIAGIAHDSKVVFAYTNGGAKDLIKGLYELAEYPNVRVINCSWSMFANSYFKTDLDEVIAAINEMSNPPLIVGIAGNEGVTDYKYPACYDYDNVLGVTNVGHRYPIGEFSPYPFWEDSWPDCHYYRPFYGEKTNNHNDKLDVVAPGILVTNITNKFAEHPEGIRLASNTSSTAPYVSGVAALVFSANPTLSAAQVKDIIRNTTDDVYHIPYNEPFLGQLGTGRINAFRAVKTADCMMNPSTKLDLAMQNSKLDYFVEPDVNTEYPWRSEDIWVRNQNDGLYVDVHQNPEYDANNPNYVYVRVTNNSCVTSSGNDLLHLYWAKANTSLNWPDYWDGSISMSGVLMGDQVGTITIPPLAIGETKTLEFAWNVPNPADYIEICATNPWHFCLLARIESTEDPMTFPEGENITTNVLNNNNIAWKNTTVVDIYPNSPTPIAIGGTIGVSNPFTSQRTFTLELQPHQGELGKALYEEAEITIALDDVLYNAWNNGGKTKSQAEEIKPKTLKITGNSASIGNLSLEAGAYGTAFVAFNFLTKQLTEKRNYTYHVFQKDVLTGQTMGGETFEVKKHPRTSFSADAGGNLEIEKNETVTLTAGAINESALYNWYDPEGNLIHSGPDLTITPEMSKTYKLEVVSDIDGFKDYDEVQITVNPYRLQSLVPNPASNQVTVNYLADGASSSYVMVVNMNTASSDNYILDVQQSNITIDVSAYPMGLYNIILVCDGEVQNSKTLIKQ
ncbi:MAG: S8 family serine peptidase [Aequorivita sp.]